MYGGAAPEDTVKPDLQLTRRTVVAGSIASLLAASGRTYAQAKEQLVDAAGGAASTDLLVLEPNSAQFVGLTQGFNRRWTAPNCAKIFLPLTEAGAQQALAQAVPFGPGKIRVRGGGHCYENFVFSDNTAALIDVSLLNDFGFDAQRGVYYAQSGGTNWDMYRQLYWRFGRTLPAGSCYSVGLGGHICGGGYGLLSRQFGLTVEADVMPLGSSLMIVFAYRDEAHFDYAHLSTDQAAAQPVHNGIFHVYGGERVRISAEKGPASFAARGRWYHVKLTHEANTGAVAVTVDGQAVPALEAIDRSLGPGKAGIGSFDETGAFRDVGIRVMGDR